MNPEACSLKPEAFFLRPLAKLSIWRDVGASKTQLAKDPTMRGSQPMPDSTSVQRPTTVGSLRQSPRFPLFFSCFAWMPDDVTQRGTAVKKTYSTKQTHLSVPLQSPMASPFQSRVRIRHAFSLSHFLTFSLPPPCYRTSAPHVTLSANMERPDHARS